MRAFVSPVGTSPSVVGGRRAGRCLLRVPGGGRYRALPGV